MSSSSDHLAYKEQKKYLLAIRLSIVVTCVFTVLTLAHLQGNLSNVIMMSTVAVCSLVSLIYVYKTKNYLPAFYIISASGVILPCLSVLFLHELTHFTEWIWICCAVLLAFLGTNNKYGFFLIFVAIATATYFSNWGVNLNTAEITKKNTIQLLALNFEFIGAFGCGGYLLFLFHDFYTRSENGLMEINSNLKEKNAQIMQQDEEKTVLVKEIHHRVKNNLQIITSLLRMQKNEIENIETQKQFGEAINRIMAMSLIHQKLYQEKSLAKIELENYLDQLLLELVDIYNLKDSVKSTIKVNLPEIGLKSIVPLGLLLNELISNSLEHGFRDKTNGEISIDVKKAEQWILVKYADNGSWKTSNIGSKSSFGLELIDLLTEQLEGEKQFETNENGSFYEFHFKNLDN